MLSFFFIFMLTVFELIAQMILENVMSFWQQKCCFPSKRFLDPTQRIIILSVAYFVHFSQLLRKVLKLWILTLLATPAKQHKMNKDANYYQFIFFTVCGIGLNCGCIYCRLVILVMWHICITETFIYTDIYRWSQNYYYSCEFFPLFTKWCLTEHGRFHSIS